MALTTHALNGSEVTRILRKTGEPVADNNLRYRCPDCGEYLPAAEMVAVKDPLTGKQENRYELRDQRGRDIVHCGRKVSVIADRSAWEIANHRRPTLYTVNKRFLSKKRRVDEAPASTQSESQPQ
jgi:hypothetical protein